MGELLLKPYEISVWEDELTQNGFIEKKLAIIGSNTMNGPNKVYDPVFTKKDNGEKTLTFSLKYKYFDPYSGNEEVINPFAALLTNERKVKLKYDDQWYEFIVKDHNESSEDYTWTYTCNDAFVLELSKNGYNIEFNSDLNNNQGTARELAKKTLQDTDWKLGEVDNFKQLVEEPIYLGVLENPSSVEIINTDTNTVATFSSDAQVYIFYSYIKNQNGKFVQFIIRDENRNYTIDDKNVITDTNYRITNELIFKDDGFYLDDNNQIISFSTIETRYHANRLAYGQLTTYDPVMGKTVERFKVGEDSDREVYKYTTYTYTTSTVVMNYITNGDNFNVLEDGSLQGWNPYNDVEEGESVNKLNLITRPELATDKKLADVSVLSQIEGFLEVNLNGPKKVIDNRIYNTVYNSGFSDNASFIDSISAGEEFVLRWRAGINDIDNLDSFSGIKAIIAKYEQDEPTRFGYYYKHINPDDIIVQFEGTPQILNNYVEGGALEEEIDEETGEGNGNYNYVINGVAQTPSTKYLYKTSDKVYVWEGVSGQFQEFNEQDGTYTGADEETHYYLPYYYIKGTANRAVSPKELRNPEDQKKIGIFLYTDENVGHKRITTKENVQRSSASEPVSEINFSFDPFPGTTFNFLCNDVDIRNRLVDEDYEDGYEAFSFEYDSETHSIHFEDRENEITSYSITFTTPLITFYIQDIQLTRYIADGNDQPVLVGNLPTATSNPVDHYYLKPDNGLTEEEVDVYTTPEDLLDAIGSQDSLVALYNENSEKNLSISVSQSNCFNILQTIAETFECWVDLVVEHDNYGAIVTDSDGPHKYVYLKEYTGKNNYAGFKYAINLSSIERNVNSDEIVTKLIVDQSQSDYTDEGYISISNAPSNPTGESYILNFDYYYNQGLLDRSVAESDKNDFIQYVSELNNEIQEKEKQRQASAAALVKVESNRNVYTELVNVAKEEKSVALGDFEEYTGYTYDEYRAIHNEDLINPQPGETPEEEEARKLSQLTEEETIYDILARIYTTSATINNYGGLLSNIDQEYWRLNYELEGYQSYSVKIWVDTDILNQRHVFVEFNDYLAGIEFRIGEHDYETTVSKKYFEITTDASVIEFIDLPNGYSIEESQYEINDNKVEKIRISSNDTQIGLIEEIDDLIEEKTKYINEFNNKYRRFIQEGTWNSTDYIDSELYYLDALQVSNTSAQPVVSYTINVVEISQLDGYEWYLFDTGDKTYVEDTEFFGWANKDGVLTPAREEVIVSEVEWHLDAPDQNVITVRNYKTRFEDLFQRISAAVQTVQYNEATYAKISSLMDADGTINQDVLLTSLNRISGKNYNLTSDGSILIDKENIIIRNLTNPANLVKINNEGISSSADGGNNWKKVIDGFGVNADAVITGSLNTNQVIIGSSDNPSFRWDKAGISAYKSDKEAVNTDGNPITVYDLKTFVRYDEYGLYGIKDGESFKAQNLQDVLDKAHFAVTWDGFFIKNSYEDGGRVSITSDNDFQVIDGSNQERIKIGSWVENGTRRYGIKIKNAQGTDTFYTDDVTGDVNVTGTINATGGNFSGIVNVGSATQDHIIIDGQDASIRSSNFQESAGYGWMINKDGDAVFNNITARGAIKTAVFEYAEIQAVGGMFIFRPSSTIRNAELVENTDDVKLTLEKPYLFKVGDWCKVSNYTDGQGEPIATSILSNNGLTHVYKVKSIDSNDSHIIILENAYTALTSGNTKVINNITDLIGGALIDMGDKANGDGRVGSSNYGIGINSSDNTVNLPPRAISLFETVVDETKNPKVSYNFRGILGTLPNTQTANISVDSSIYNYMAGTQGIYTDNMYIGDLNQYIAFYKDENGNKQLRIKANQIMFEVADNPGHYEDVADIEAEGVPGPTGPAGPAGPAGQDGQDGQDGENSMLLIISAPNTIFEKNPDSSTNALTATAILYNGNTPQTSDVSFTWYKYINGNYNTEITATTDVNNTVWKSTTTITNDTLNVKPDEVDGYASFKVVASYAPSGESTKTFDQYIAFTDKSDLLQVSVHSTIGLQIVNSQGIGAIYARVTQDGQEIDPVPEDIEVGISYPDSSDDGDLFVKLDGNDIPLTSRKARLMIYNGSSWDEVGADCEYEWTFRDKNNEPINSNVPYQDINKTKNQFLYINSDLIRNKITADVKVTKN